jgi:hypothetical protein
MGSFRYSELFFTKYLGAYIQRQMRAGRSVIIPKFGTFTFTHPDVNLAVRHKL